MDHRHDHHDHGRREAPGPEASPGRTRQTGRERGHGDHAGHDPGTFRNRFWLALALTLPVLFFAEQFQIWFGYRAPSFPGSGLVNPLLGSVLYFYGGWPFLRGALPELKRGRPAMMTLVSLAITVAYGYSMAVSFGFGGKPFFWELATLVDVMLLGHWLEMASVQGASRALQHLASLVPSEAHRLVNGKAEDVPVDRLVTGDRILIRPGEQIPADGRVVDGASSVNEAFLTGESRPVSKEPDDEVVAGAVNSEGALTVEVTRTGADTTLSQIQRLVEEAQRSRSRFQDLGNRAAAWLFYLALGIGATTFVAWAFAPEGLPFAITRAVTVLVIACPHALGLAIPLVTVNATALSAKNGILVRNREAFERARAIEIVAFDKTGTLTEGRFGVSRVVADGIAEERALALAAALEARSEHPLAKAIVAEAEARSLEPPAVEAFEVTAGKGVAGRLEGVPYAIGRPEWAGERGLDLSDGLRRALAEADERGESAVVLVTEERALALVALADRVRPSAKRTIAALAERGLTPVMITGDAEAVAATVAAELGIARYHARVLPQDKAGLIARLKEDGPTAFVGDGINDAPALLEADLGVAIGAGTNVAIESADLVLVEDDPLDAVAVLHLSRATYGKMVQNLFWATGYNVIALPLAAGVAAGWGILLSPAVGALLMSLSTVVVALNAMLLRRLDLTGSVTGRTPA